MRFIRQLPVRPHPFPLLLHVEWILLGVTVLGLLELPLALLIEAVTVDSSLGSALQLGSAEILTLLWVALFAFMGLRLPTDDAFSKIAYLTLGIALVGLANYTLQYIDYCFPLLLIIVIRSCLIFPLAGRLTIALGMLGWFAGAQYFSLTHEWLYIEQNITVADIPEGELIDDLVMLQHPLFLMQFWIQAVLFFVLVLIFVLLLVNALLAEYQSRQKLMIAHDQLRQYAYRIEDQATLQERNRIAREIHDSLGHLLTAQSLQFENALFFLPPTSEVDKSKAFIQQGKQLCSQALNELRRSVSVLRSDPLAGKCLEDAIAKLLEQFQSNTHISLSYSANLRSAIPKELSTTVYRILEEALTNICKHSQAQFVSVQLMSDPREDLALDSFAIDHQPMIFLAIKDDGRGFKIHQNSRGFGLQGIQERVMQAGGQITIKSEPYQGCQITVCIPLPRAIA